MVQVDVIVTTTGGIEEDLIKCLAPTYKGDFSLPGAFLRSKGLNRIGNLLVPNDNYCKFEDWVIPILDQMLKEQREEVLTSNHSRVTYSEIRLMFFPLNFPLFSHSFCLVSIECTMDSIQGNPTLGKRNK